MLLHAEFKSILVLKAMLARYWANASTASQIWALILFTGDKLFALIKVLKCIASK